ncbi:MAG: regulatory protein RecX [Phocaeicola sp.]
MKKEYSTTEAHFKAETYCSAAERCLYDVELKLTQWGVAQQEQQPILDALCNEKYIDESRYCRAFVRDKYRFNQWGRTKIVQSLRMKRIAHEVITESLFGIDEQEYTAILRTLLKQKSKNIKAKNSYEHTGKLIRFAVGKGYEINLIQSLLKELEIECDFLD